MSFVIVIAPAAAWLIVKYMTRRSFRLPTSKIIDRYQPSGVSAPPSTDHFASADSNNGTVFFKKVIDAVKAFEVTTPPVIRFSSSIYVSMRILSAISVALSRSSSASVVAYCFLRLATSSAAMCRLSFAW